MLDTVIRFFQSGGPFMYPILAVLAIGLAITVERWMYLTNAQVRNRSALRKLIPMLEKCDLNGVLQVAQKSNATVAKILHQGLLNFNNARRRDDIEASMEEAWR